MTAYNVVAYSAQAAKPAFRYAQRALLPVQLDAATVHIRATIPADIPDNAIVTKADLVFGVAVAWSGGKTFNLRRHVTAITNAITWATRPSVTGSTWSATVTTPTTSTTFTVDVSDDVQEYIAGNLDNYGWQMVTTSAAALFLDGVPAAFDKPYLDLEWTLPGEPPTDLAPDGRIATGNPWLTFQLPEGSTHIQVQVSATDFGATVYDSGMIAASGNAFELSGYTIPDAATRYWRIKAWSGGVASEWSATAEVIRDDLAALTITDPGATTGDPDPTLEWTFTGQDAWQATLYDHNLGRVVADSGRNATSDLAWTPDTGLRGEGEGTFTLHVWDDKEDRVPTTGVPVYAEETLTFELNAGGSDAGPTDLSATQREGSPIIDLAWAFAVEPDRCQILRNGVYLARVDGAIEEYADRTAPRNVNLTYKVLAVNSGVVSSVGDSELIYPRSVGVWLLDPDVDFAEDAVAVLLGKDQGTQDMTEQAIVHQVNNRAAVRRRIGITPPSGTQTGVLMDALGFTAAESYEQLMAWKKQDAGKVYRLVFGNWNIPVTVGDIFAAPTPDSREDAQYVAGFSWWQTDDELPWG